jgi:hypothetical protein
MRIVRTSDPFQCFGYLQKSDRLAETSNNRRLIERPVEVSRPCFKYPGLISADRMSYDCGPPRRVVGISPTLSGISQLWLIDASVGS